MWAEKNLEMTPMRVQGEDVCRLVGGGDGIKHSKYVACSPRTYQGVNSDHISGTICAGKLYLVWKICIHNGNVCV